VNKTGDVCRPVKAELGEAKPKHREVEKGPELGPPSRCGGAWLLKTDCRVGYDRSHRLREFDGGS